MSRTVEPPRTGHQPAESELSPPYDRGFFERLQPGSTRSAAAIVPILLNLIAPRSVVDVGCGQGAWLASFRQHGVDDVFGIDGSWVDPRSLDIPPDRFKSADLSETLSLDRRFDLVMSLEVAEHLPPTSAETFVRSLTELGAVVLFSAAIPHQGGVVHLNEQWPEYWAALFGRFGYTPIDCLRPCIWDNPDVDCWYAQNALLFVAEGQIASYPRLLPAAKAREGWPLSVVHPRTYLAAVERLDYLYFKPDPARLSLSTLLPLVPRVALNALKRRLGLSTP